MNVTRFERSALHVIDVLCSTPNADGQELLDDGELANTICEDASRASAGDYAPDYDGPSGAGDPACDFNVLIEARDLGVWQKMSAKYGCVVRLVSEAPEDDHYGDGHWAGVDIVSVPHQDRLVYWIDR